MSKPKIVFSLSDFYQHKHGWTYFLLSKDKHYLKIGKTTSDLGLRIKSINNDVNYKGNEFSLLIACVGARNEKTFHHFLETIALVLIGWNQEMYKKIYLMNRFGLSP
ncbi:hypothetical protein IDG82_17710 [Vibrio cholerae]|nr:hypothetical protein [Vibrio cholerae]MBD1198907.1 hypothetical protein [Vibrio cholerae]